MSTTIRPEISKKNVCWIDKNRHYELKYFCRQYKKWKTAYSHLDNLKSVSLDETISNTNVYSNPTEKCALTKARYAENIEMIEKAALDTDKTLADYILKGVTEGLSYDTLRVKYNIPCCKDTYYKLYRRFFWLLNKARC